MTSLASARITPPAVRVRGCLRVSLPLIVQGMRHAAMLIAMLPCVLGAHAGLHAYSAMVLFALAAAHAPRARRSAGQAAPVIDTLAMAVLAVATALGGHTTLGAHAHAQAAGLGAPTILVLITVAAWVALRLSVRPSTLRGWCGLIGSAAMVVVMAATPALHSL